MPRDGACILWSPASCASASESKGGAAGQKRADAQHVVVRCRSGCSHRPIICDTLHSRNSRMKERNYTSTWARNPNAKRAVQIPVELRANAEGKLQITDVMHLMDFLFNGGPPPAPMPRTVGR